MVNKKQKNNDENTNSKEEQSSQEEKIAQLTDLLKRNQADFENYRKQTEKRVQEIHKFAAKKVVVQLLPLLDNFTLALKNQQGSKEDILMGVEMIYSQLQTILKDQGVEQIDVGEQFDPATQEPLMKVAHEKPENTVLEVIQQGYRLHGNLLRPARVKLSAGSATNAEKSESQNEKNQQQTMNDNSEDQ